MYRVCCSEKELQEMCEDSTDIFKLDQYMDRPGLAFSGGKYSILVRFCYTEFFAHYTLVPEKQIIKKMTANQIYLKRIIAICYPLTDVFKGKIVM